jgi:type III secretory pathway component EscU
VEAEVAQEDLTPALGHLLRALKVVTVALVAVLGEVPAVVQLLRETLQVRPMHPMELIMVAPEETQFVQVGSISLMSEVVLEILKEVMCVVLLAEALEQAVLYGLLWEEMLQLPLVGLLKQTA